MIDFGFGVWLGPIDRSYSDRLREWRNDPRIWKWCRQNDVISDMDQSRWMETQSQDPSVRMYAVRHIVKGLIGVAGLTGIDLINRRAEFSLYINPDAHRGGLGRMALKTLLSHGFDNLNLNVIWGEVFEGNPALLMFLKMGFVDEGVRRDFYFRKGKYIDATLISMKAEEWVKRSSQSAPSR